VRLATPLLVALGLVACQTEAARPETSSLHADVEALIAQGRVPEALDLVERARATTPENAGVWRERARCLVLQRELDGALRSLERAIALEETDPWSHYERGYVLAELGRLDQAVASFTRAIELDPGHYKALEHRGSALALMSRHEEAVRDLTLAIERWGAGRGELARVHLFRASSLQALGRAAEAELDLQLGGAIR
jgi:tetratricopeptide (TPR) repeat protein